MKTIKPFRLSVLHRPYQYLQQNLLGVTVLVLYDYAQGSVVADEQSLWQLFKDESVEVFGVEALDMGVPKHKAEIILNAYGFGCYSERGRTAVEVTLNNVKKSLWVNGERYWVNNKISDPLPFEKMPINWQNAYGGSEFPKNPVGKGHRIQEFNGMNVQFLPNIEDPHHPIHSANQEYEPAGFSAIPIEYPGRNLLMGTYDDEWRTKYFPGFAKDIDWTYFNQSPLNQRLNSLTSGDIIRYTHLHPTKPIVEVRVPDFVIKTFIKTIDSGDTIKGALSPVDLSLTTWWGFPHRDQAILAYQGNIQIKTDDADDISHLMLALELPDQPKSIEYYEEVLTERLDKKLAHLYASLDSRLVDKRVMRPLSFETLPVSPQLKKKMGLLERKLEANKEKLELLNKRAQEMDPKMQEDMMLTRAMMPEMEDDEALAAKLLAGQMDLETLVLGQIEREKKGQDFSVQRKLMREKLKEVKQKNKKLSKAQRQSLLAESAEEARKFKEKQKEKLLKSQPLRQINPSAQSADLEEQRFHAMDRREEEELAQLQKKYRPDFEAVSWDEAVSVEEIEDLAFFKKPNTIETDAFKLTQRSFVGQSYQQLKTETMLVSDCHFTECDFKESRMRLCHFERVTFQQCDLTGINIEASTFKECTFINCVMPDINADKASFFDCRLLHCQLSGWSHFRLFINHLAFDECKIENFNFVRARTHKISFEHCHLQRVTFTKGCLRSILFDSCQIDSIAFVSFKKIINFKINNCTIEKLVIQSLTQIESFTIADSILKNSSLRELNLTQAQLTNTNLGQNDFSKTNFSFAFLENICAKEALFIRTNFHGAKIFNSDFSMTICKAADFTSTYLNHISFFTAELALIRTDSFTRQEDCWLGRSNVYPQVIA